MKTKKIILPMVCCIPLMSSCATEKPMDKPAWNIQPVYKVNNVAADNPNAQYQVGRYFQGQKRYEQAAEAYKKAIASDDGFVEAHNGLGVVYSLQGKYDAAVTEFVIAIGLSPKASHLYNNLGHTFYLKGAYAEAVSALEQAASLDPGNARTMKNLGMAYAKAGEANKSQQAFAAAAKPAAGQSKDAQATTEPATNNQVELAASNTPAPASVANAAPAVQAEPVSGVGQAVAELPKTEILKPELQKSELQKSELQKSEVPALELQTLALPKDRGIITPAPVSETPIAATPIVAAPIASVEVPAQPVQLATISEPNKAEDASQISALNKSEKQLATPAEIPTTSINAQVDVPAAQVTEAAVEAPAAPIIQPAIANIPTISTVSIERLTLMPPDLMHLEVSNGNGTTGMARKVATYLQEIGFAKARLTNQRPYTVQTTQIQYRSGHQADAEQLRANLPGSTAILQSNNLRDDINLRVVLGKDLMQHTVYFNGNTQKLQITRGDFELNRRMVMK